MWREELILNKIFAIIMILIGALLVPVEWDATFFLLYRKDRLWRSLELKNARTEAGTTTRRFLD